VDEVSKAAEIGLSLVDKFEFWGYNVTRFGNDTIFEVQFAQYFNMFLKFIQESTGYTSWVQCEKEKDRYIEDYRRK
jgi:hypothetical protein